MMQEFSVTRTRKLVTRKLTPAQIKQLVREANRFDSYILIEANNQQLNVKNPLSAMSMFPTIEGESILVQATGLDAEQALDRLCRYLCEE